MINTIRATICLWMKTDLIVLPLYNSTLSFKSNNQYIIEVQTLIFNSMGLTKEICSSWEFLASIHPFSFTCFSFLLSLHCSHLQLVYWGEIRGFFALETLGLLLPYALGLFADLQHLAEFEQIIYSCTLHISSCYFYQQSSHQ